MRIIDIKVSVILPCYNAESTIIDALDSLLKQTYNDFEVIIIDDGSTDKTNYIISDYISKTASNVKFRLFRQENKGVSSARNFGISKSVGEYITFLDSDDMYHSDFLTKMVNNMENSDFDTLYCCYSRKKNDIFNSSEYEKETVYLNNYNLLDNFMYRIGPCGFFNFIYKKEIIERNNIFFNENLRYAEDIEFIWKYLINCKRGGGFINTNLYWYRNNALSVTNNVNWDITQTIDVIKNIEQELVADKNEFLEKYNSYMYDRAIWAISKEFSFNRDRVLFEKFVRIYDVKKSMANMIFKGNGILVRISSFLYCLNRNLFYIFVRRY